MTDLTIDDASMDLKKSILRLESMIEAYRAEMTRNYEMLEQIKLHMIRTNQLLINIRKLMQR